jgi:hypothetical protein
MSSAGYAVSPFISLRETPQSQSDTEGQLLQDGSLFIRVVKVG